ncbi:MAG: ABC transporter substrate-binding protein [Lachnospiraceae bacterium]|jgi:raffinose/stachyose/melibiose transport system substrate-binding protein|nr:ABC transporter substrate-binding protein [Lachnospiraceae bacterium]MBQ5376149.1 ABC transporter substrate-binding protein [Lachnospiraceae bacterium]
MKKKLLSVVLSAAMVSGILAGCGEAAPAANDAAAPAAEASEAAPAEDTAPAEAGSGKVYLLNFKPETDEAWQELAATYTEQTGVPVTVLTAADGQYSTTLQSEMAKSEAPTIFNIGNATAAQTWDEYTYDLKDSALYNHLTDKSLTVEYNGKVAAVANCYECYGIIYNKTILGDYCTMDNAVVSSIDEINSLDTLVAVAEDINNRVDEINEQFGYELTEAFASAGLDDGSSWRFSGHLANMPLYYEFKDDNVDLIAGEGEITGKYLDNFKKVWDMYVNTSEADPMTLNSGAYNAETEFGMGEAVFYQNGDWEFSALTNEENGYTVTADDLAMMPIYFGVDDANEGLCVGTENHWAVNAKAPQEDIDSTLAFLEWVITSDEGRDAITNKMGLSAPFDTFTGDYASNNAFAACAGEYMANGKTSVAWSFNATPNVDDWRADVVAALTAYTTGSGDWSAVEKAFTEGWAEQWKLAEEAANN